MRIFVKAKSKSKIEKVEKIDEHHFVVFVKEPPEDGRANYAIERALAEYFGISGSRVRIMSGLSSRQKTIEVDA